MARVVELRRHTEADGDVLTPNGVQAAVEIGTRLEAGYDVLISSGAQRATQSLACMLAGLGRRLECGVTVDPTFRSEVEERWFAAAKKGGGGLESFKAADPGLVEEEARPSSSRLRGRCASSPSYSCAHNYSAGGGSCGVLLSMNSVPRGRFMSWTSLSLMRGSSGFESRRRGSAQWT